MKQAKLFYAATVLLFSSAVFVLAEEPSAPEKFIKVGFISPLTGPATKYGANQAAEITVEEINAEPKFSEEAPKTKAFIAAYEKKFKTTGIPYGMWTSESYDGVMLLAKVMNECGPDVENVAACLSKVKDYEGASGVFSINEKHDGVREYILKRLVNGEIKEY